MRILCLLNRELASNVALNLLLPTFADHEVLVGLSDGAREAPSGESPLEARELYAAEYELTNRLLFPLVERAALPDDHRRYLTFNEIAHHRAIPSIALNRPNGGEELERIAVFAPDVIVTIRYRAILQRPVLDLPRFGVLNLHSALLPAYRGILGTLRALTNGDADVGCTLHYITDGTIDTGPVVGTASLPVDRNRSLLWHVLALYPPGTRMLAQAIEALAAGHGVSAEAQPAHGGRYYSRPTAEEWAGFREAGWRAVDARDLVEVASRYSLS